ncbi:hypothetical protein M9458_026337, partial [Cirrhinus mrigala]
IDKVSTPQSPQYKELLEVVTCAVAKLNINWPAKSQAELQRSKLDERFLRLPFFPDLHTEVARSWNVPFSACLFIPASYNYGNVARMEEHGYRAMPRVEQPFTSYLLRSCTSSRCKSPQHWWTADLSLRATKETTQAIGHLWLTLSDMKEKDRVFLLDAPLSPSGLFGDAINSVVDRYQEARKQAAAFQRELLGGSSPGRVPAPRIERHKNRASPLALLPIECE